MSPVAQRIAVAKVCGFVLDGYLGKPESIIGWKRGGVYYSVLPDYVNSLDAISEAEKTLSDDQYAKYALWLGPLTTGRARAYISATAAQRCEALLRTLNLWTE